MGHTLPPSLIWQAVNLRLEEVVPEVVPSLSPPIVYGVVEGGVISAGVVPVYGVLDVGAGVSSPPPSVVVVNGVVVESIKGRTKCYRCKIWLPNKGNILTAVFTVLQRGPHEFSPCYSH